MAPAALNFSKSPFTSSLSMLRMSRPGVGFLPLTWSWGPIVIHPLPICQPSYPPLRHGGLAEDLRVVIDEPLGILRSDHDAVEVHRYLPLVFSAAGPAPTSNR